MAGAHGEDEEGKGEEEDSQGPEEGLGLIQTPQHCLCDVVCYVDFLQCAWSQGMDKALVNCLFMVGPQHLSWTLTNLLQLSGDRKIVWLAGETTAKGKAKAKGGQGPGLLLGCTPL